jgi:hypothetical protein
MPRHSLINIGSVSIPILRRNIFDFPAHLACFIGNLLHEGMAAIESHRRPAFCNPVILDNRVPLIAYYEAKIKHSLLADSLLI